MLNINGTPAIYTCDTIKGNELAQINKIAKGIIENAKCILDIYSLTF